MKEKQNKRWGLKLLSLLCAFLVWLGVVNVADPIVTNTVEVPVEIVNAEVLEKNDLTYEIVGKKTTTVAYDVKTTNAYRIRPSDFRAYADMTELWSVTGAIPIKVEVLKHGEYLSGSPVSKMSTIKIDTEPLQKKRFDLNVTYVGALEDGYEAGAINLSPSYLYVEGPESLIGQISSAGIEVSLEGLSVDAEGKVPPQFYDANGNKIELDERIECSCEAVSYSMQVLKVKNLTLDFEVSGQVAEGYRFTGVTCDVKSVPVIGLKSVLASLNTITIPGESLSLDDAKTDVVRTIDLTEYLPLGVSLAGEGRHEVNVVLTVEQLKERMYTVEVNESSFVGTNEDYKYQVVPNRVSIRIQALEEELDSLELDSGDIEIDVTSLEEGVHVANVTLKLELDQVYKVINISSCNVSVMKVAPETESSSEEETTEGESAGGEASESGEHQEAGAEAAGHENTDESENAGSEPTVVPVETSAASEG